MSQSQSTRILRGGNPIDSRSSVGLVSTYFPAADTEEELHDVRLLLLLKLLDVLEGTHLGCKRTLATALPSIKAIPNRCSTRRTGCGGLACLGG